MVWGDKMAYLKLMMDEKEIAHLSEDGQSLCANEGVPQRELPVFLFLQDEPVPPATQQILFGLPRCSSRQGWPGRMPVPDGQ